MKIQKLLILSDFSEVSTSLLQYGLKLAEHLDARVWVQHTYSFPTTISGEAYLPEDSFKNYEKHILQEFDMLKEQLPALKDAQFEISYGDLLAEMNKLIDRKHIDLVVIGNQGGGFITNILGSNTIKIIQHAHCPVLSVPEGLSFQAYQHMAMAIDLKAIKPAIISLIADFARDFRSRIDIMHISEAPVAVDAKQMTHTLDKVLESVPHQFFHVHTSAIEKGIEQHMGGNNNDLLVLQPREHSFFDSIFQKSISRQMAYQKKVPLLTIHE